MTDAAGRCTIDDYAVAFKRASALHFRLG